MNRKDCKPVSSTSEFESPLTASAPPPACTAPEARVDGGRNEAELGHKDATPSNTASYNCNQEEKQHKEDLPPSPYFQVLRFGVDSGYFSYLGELHPEVQNSLNARKSLAQSHNPAEVAQAQYPIRGHVFEVKDKGAKMFPYILEDNCFRIQLSKPSKTVPMAYVKISSGYLAHVGPVEAEKELRAILEEMGELKESVNVSRIDLFVDFVSSENMEWTRQAWVTRASSVDAYSVDGKFSGWSIGKGGILGARLYNKILEIQKSRKEYLFGLWRSVGWIPGHPVWRMEFEIKREALTQKGFSKLPDVMNHLNGLWSYLTTEWLRLTIPNEEDQTRSRWPVHPLWGYLSSVDWETDGGPLLRRFTPERIPTNAKLFNLAFSNITAFMARERITDLYEGVEAFIAAMSAFQMDKASFLGLPFDDFVAEKVALKARLFNTILNNPDREAERQTDEQARAAQAQHKAAEAYRKAADGE